MSTNMTRRGFAAVVGAAPALAAAAAQRPNIVFVLSDDHSAPYLGCYGDPVIRTPNLDRFAAEGMRFNRMFTSAPQCVPSRAAYLTGRSPVAVRVGRFSTPLPPDIKAIPDHLREAGYYTGICRRIYHLDGPGRLSPDSKRVFDEHGMLTFHKRVDFLDTTPSRDRTPAIVGKFLDQVPGGKPFFLWVNFSDPHHPWDKDAIAKPHDPAALKLPPHLPDLPGMRADLARYYDEISRMDDEFAAVTGELAKRGLEKNTIVVFAGDNGMAFPHGKGSLYDPGLNVPLLVRWPGVVKAGAVTDELVSGEDLAPTLLEAAGLAVPKEMSGRSYLKLLRGEPHKARDTVFAARIHHGNSPFGPDTKANSFDLSRCVRSSRYKLIYNCTPQMQYQPVDSVRDPGWRQTVEAHSEGKLPEQLAKAYFTLPRPVFELFDLDKDPGELNNLAGRPELAEVERELKLAMQEKMILDYDYLPPPMPL